MIQHRLAGVAFGLSLLAGIFGSVSAHEVRPAYLELRIAGGDTVFVMWKVPARGDLPLSLGIELPDQCIDVTPHSRQHISGSWIDRWTSVCSGSMIDNDVSITGLSSTLTDVLVRLERADGTTQVARIKPSRPLRQSRTPHRDLE